MTADELKRLQPALLEMQMRAADEMAEQVLAEIAAVIGRREIEIAFRGELVRGVLHAGTVKDARPGVDPPGHRLLVWFDWRSKNAIGDIEFLVRRCGGGGNIGLEALNG